MKILRDPSGKVYIGGWLYLPVIGTVLSLFIASYGIFLIFSAYEPSFSLRQKIMFLYLLSCLSLTLVLAVASIWWLKVRSPNFPKGIIVLYLFDIVSIGFALIFFSELRGDGVERDLVRAIFAAAVFVPYMLLSKRVRQTFGWPK